MTRILQIRRGTSAQNDGFTGLAGEITMDTTNKTIRVHDGETLGGIALARADAVDAAHEFEPFDINSVSAEFWQNLFSTYGASQIQSVSTPEFRLVNNVSIFDETFDTLSTLPLFARAFLVCQNSEAGYSAGDTTAAFGIGDYSAPLIYTFVSNNVLHAVLFAGAQSFWVPNKATGVKTNIDVDKWKLKITVYY